MSVDSGNSQAMPWRERALITLGLASQIVGLSTASLYNLEAAGRLEFRRLAGRTLVTSESLSRLIDSSQVQAPARDRTAKAVAARAKRAAASWQ